MKKHSKIVDTGTLCITNPLQLANEKTDSGTTYSDISPIKQKGQHQYQTQIPHPSRQALPKRPQT